MGGDFNVPLQPHLDRKNISTPLISNRYRQKLNEALETFELCDIWRKRNPQEKRFTFHRRHQGSRIDYWFIPEYLENKVTGIDIKIGVHTDHSLITMEIDKDEEQRGPGWWKLNTLLLNDQEYREGVRGVITNCRKENTNLNPASLWDLTKYKIKTYSIQYSKKKSQEMKQEEKNLSDEVQQLTEQLDEGKDVADELNSYKRELEALEKQKAQKIIFRSKCNWASYGDKPTKFFLNLEKKKFQDKLISQVRGCDGSLKQGSKEVLSAITDFYTTLYTKDNNEDLELSMGEFITGAVPQVTDTQHTYLEAKLTKNDLKVAVKQIKKGKCPGSDGLPTEFYTCFWEEIEELVYNSLEFAYEIGELSNEQKRGIITLIPKKDLDRLNIRNWRPITLLNTDYKILTKALAIKLQNVLPNLIYPDQTGFMKNRYIGTNIRLAEDMIDFANMTSTSALLLAIDFEKAFDSVGWESIIDTMKVLGFGENYIGWIKVIYKNIATCIANNGFHSSWFQPSRGTRQGCCLSPYLFLLVVEILAIAVWEHKNIRGITVSGKEIKISLYADDVTCFLGDWDSLHRLDDILQRFRRYSGLKVSREKTKVMQLGPQTAGRTYTCPYKLVESVNILGIKVGIHKNEMLNYKWNYKSRLDKCKAICNSWSDRALSLKGKVTVLNSLVTSTMLFPVTTTSCPAMVLLEFKRIITNFLWSSSVSRVAYETVCSPVGEG